jgi:flagellar biosynthesis protein FlhA
VITIDPALEDRVAEGVSHGERGWSIHIPPHEVEAICARIDDATAPLSIGNRPHVVLASPHVRAPLKQLTAPRLPRLVVLGSDEITRDTHIESVALIDDS